MKCLCGYECSEAWDVPKDEAKFILLNVAFFPGNEHDRYYKPQPAALYACPKCGTVKVDHP